MKKLLLCLAVVVSAHAQTFSSDFTPAAAFVSTTRVSVGFDLILNTPGTYTAQSWNVGFDVKIGAPGDYVLVATGGPISIGFDVKGPASGTAKITLVSASPITVGGGQDRSVTVVTSRTVPVTPIDPVISVPIPLPAGTAGAAPLVNISTRATLAAGGALTPGFVVGGSVARRVLVRGIGPGLGAFGVAAAAASVELAVFSGSGMQIGATGTWAADLAPVMAGVGAFALANGSRDAALLLTLAPGNYTARLAGVGEVLAEIYFVD